MTFVFKIDGSHFKLAITFEQKGTYIADDFISFDIC